ncbi:sigma 54-interacting transcriptional regulator [Haloimpatiens sp. FM7315]|uniref:sigma 54-interacting transcriptional regulator n=1 Tax=Haloimpatiens sp. FM7315 TaxID=3298609 RepID=UPI003709E369
MSNKEKVHKILKKIYKDTNKGVTSKDIEDVLKIGRANVSNYLNQLSRDSLVKKVKSRPVYFIPLGKIDKGQKDINQSCFSTLIGKTHSLKKVVKKAKAAILYPPYGLHSIIYGETGVGKSMLAKYMYEFSVEAEVRSKGCPFVTFNCADYANNPQLLMGHIFGVEKGAYTGAQNSKKGLLEVANGGILFLDEVHRLPPEGQEMLFTFIDKGVFKRMGESSKDITSEVLIIAATTENPESTLLDTFNRRIPMVIEMPPLRERSLVERIELIKFFLKKEALRVKIPIKLHRQVMKSLMLYKCKNNIGQLQSDVRLAVANAYLNYISDSSEFLELDFEYFNSSLKNIKSNYRGRAYEVEILVPKDIDYYVFYPSGKEENFGFKESDEENHSKGKAQLSLFREGIIENSLIEKLFMNTEFFKLCQNIKDIIQNELSLVLSERKFYNMAIYINSIIESNSFNNNFSKLDINEVRQSNKEEFKVALKIVSVIESQFNIFLSIEKVAYVALFLSKDVENENVLEKSDVDVIVAMHGDSTASSMVKVVKDILGCGNIYSFDMNLNKSYKKIVFEFKELLENIQGKEGILLLTDMGSLNSFDNVIKEEIKVDVKTVPMVTTLVALEAMQKLSIGFSLVEVYNSIKEIIVNSFEKTNEVRKKENLIIIGYDLYDESYKDSKKIIKDKLAPFVDNIDIVFIPRENQKSFLITIKNIMEEKNVVAIINKDCLNIKGTEYFTKEEIKSLEGIDRLKNVIKLSEGYYDIKEGLKSSLNYTNYAKVLEDVKDTIDDLLETLNIKKQYDMVVGLSLHISFMIDGLVGNTRVSQNFPCDKLNKNKGKISIIKRIVNKLEKKYNIKINDNECYGILSIVSIESEKDYKRKC